MKAIILTFVNCGLIAACTNSIPLQKIDPDAKFVYETDDLPEWNSESRYDITGSYYIVSGKSYSEDERKRAESGAQVKIVHTDGYIELSPLPIIVAKSNPSQFYLDSSICQSKQLSLNVFETSCLFLALNKSLTTQYSVDKGVINFQAICEHDRVCNYRLRSPVGIFANALPLARDN